MLQVRNNSMYKIIGIVLAAGIASLGTVPYGYRFAHLLEPYGYPWLVIIFMGVLLAVTAAVANMGLGIYSLLNVKIKQNEVNPILLITISAISAIPTGFICFFAYQEVLSLPLNLLTTLAVTLTNAAIGYTAIFNLIIEIKTRSQTMSTGEKTSRIIGFLIGLTVSLTSYMAAVNGLTELFNKAGLDRDLAFNIACVVGLIPWVPYASLFANAMQITAGKFYEFVTNFSKFTQSMNTMNILVFILAICSGASFAQIARDFFSPDMDIPGFFKVQSVQSIIYHVIVPLAFMTSAAVNFLAMLNILKNKKRRQDIKQN